MTDNDLRAAAEAANNGEWQYAPRDKDTTGGSHGPRYGADVRFIALASPDRILGLLDENKELRESLDELVDRVDDLEARSIRSGGEFHVWAEERYVTEARDKARSLLKEGGAALAAREPAPSLEGKPTE